MKKLILAGYGLKYPIYVIGTKIIISKTLYKNTKFIIEGLNLSKAEMEIFGGKRFEFKGVLNIRLGNLIFTYNQKGYIEQCKNMKIIDEKIYNANSYIK